MKRLTKAEIIDETVAFYSEDPEGRRAQDSGGSCQYIARNGSRCGVGRCMTPRGAREAQRIQDAEAMGGIMADELGDLDTFLMLRYRGHTPEFWNQVQGLHDDDDNWNGELSVAGQVALADLRTDYA